MKIFYLLAIGFATILAACGGPKQLSQTPDQNSDPYKLEEMDFTIEGDTSLIYVRSEYIEGITQYELGNYYQAVDHLLAAYIKMPQFAGVNYALADAYLRLRDINNATFYALEAVKINPTNKYYRMKLAEIYGAAGNAEGVIYQLEQAAEIHKGDLEILYLLANTLNRQKKLLEANEVYRKMLKYTGDDIQVLYARFKNFDELGLADSALATLKRMERVDPKNLNTLNTLTRYYMDKGETDEAKKTMSNALRLKPDDFQTIINLADIYLSESKWDSAATTLIQIVNDEVTPARNKMELVQYLYGKYRNEPESEELRKATNILIKTFLETEPDFAMGHALASDFYLTAGMDEEAAESLVRTTELMPQNDAAWKTLVQVLYTQGSYVQAIEKGTQADEIFPDDALIQFFVGASYFITNQNKPAVEWLTNATKAPADAHLKSAIYGMLGDLYSAEKKWDLSDKAYESALKFNPENENVLNNYAYYVSERTDDVDELTKAKEMSLKAIEISPGNASYLDTVGWVYYKLGEYEKAREFIQKSIETGEASGIVLEHMGDVFKELGDLENAKIWWQQALDKQPDLESAKQKLEAGS